MEENQYPSIKEQAKNLGDLFKAVATDTVQGKSIFASSEEQEKRISICDTCEHNDKESNRCRECGCYLKTKVTIAAAWCPIKKWDKVE